MSEEARYELFLRLADDDDDGHLYLVEEWFVDRPTVETISALLDEAKRAFAALYGPVDAGDFSVEIRRLRPRDNHRPASAPAPSSPS